MDDISRPRSDWRAAAASLDESLTRLLQRLTAAEADLRLARSSYQALVVARHTHLALAEAGPADVPLTPQEVRVCSLVAAGMSNREVAAALHVSVNTVKTHVKNILVKLRLRSRWQVGERSGDSIPDVAPGVISRASRPPFTPRAIGLDSRAG
jgi:DNA-binding NarL/FixJ family response regulator